MTTRKTKLRQFAKPAYSTGAGDGSPATRAEIGARMKPTRKRLDMLSALATGWLPWGVKWHEYLVRDGNCFVLCCGHVMTFNEAAAFVSSGLLTPVVLVEGDREALLITQAGQVWLSANWTPAQLRGLRSLAAAE